MKTMTKILTTLALSVAMASPAMALTIQSGAVDVGLVDTVVGVKSGGNASPAAESIWVASILGTGYGVTSNIAGSNILYATNVSGTYAFSLQGLGTPTSAIDYVLVKNSTTFLLLKNDASRNWAVFKWADNDVEFTDANGRRYEVDYDLNGRGSNIGQTSISHYALVSGPQTFVPPPPQSVPEPATLSLMGLGLVFAGLRRRGKAR